MESVDDLLGPAPRKRKKNGSKKVDDLLGPRQYRPLVVKDPRPDGIFAARKEKGKNLGRTCLICKEELEYKSGRPPVICRKKKCFRAYRNLYRHDYDKVRGS